MSIDKYKSPSIFEPPYFILHEQLNDALVRLTFAESENMALKIEIEKYKIRQTELLQQIYNLTKHQKGLNQP